MVSELDARLADLAVELQVIDRARMNQVLAEIEQLAAPTPLINYLVSKGLIQPGGLDLLKREWYQRNPQANDNSGERPRGLTTRRESKPLLESASTPSTTPAGSGTFNRPATGSFNPPNNPPQGSGTFSPPPNVAAQTAAATLSQAEIQSDQLLVRLLHAHQVVPQPVLKELLDTAQASQQRLGKLLIDRQHIAPDRLTQALQYCQTMRRICSSCAYVHDVSQGVPPQCPKCNSAWFEDSLEKIQAGPSQSSQPQLMAPGPAASGGIFDSAPNTIAPGPGVVPPPPIQAGPNPGAAPMAANKDEMDFLKLPAGYSKNANQSLWNGMLPTSSMRLHASQLQAALAKDAEAPPKHESSDSGSGSSEDGLEDLGKSMDELNIMSGKSLDELNILTGQSSDEMTIGQPQSTPDLSPMPPPLAVGGAPAMESDTKVEEPAPKQRPGKKPAKANAKAKKGCFGKSAAALLFAIALLYPIVGWALN